MPETTDPMRYFREVQDAKTRRQRAIRLILEAAEKTSTAADLLTLDGADSSLLRQDAQALRDRAAKMRTGRPQ